MKYFYILFALVVFSCAKPLTTEFINDNKQFEIVSMPFVNEQDTTYVNELRFYKIKTAKKTRRFMARKFGKWDEVIAGKYQENIQRHIWRNVTLFEDRPPFTVITDGTETGDAYFAAVMVFDSESNDCLTIDHELRDRLVQLFY